MVELWDCGLAACWAAPKEFLSVGRWDELSAGETEEMWAVDLVAARAEM